MNGTKDAVCLLPLSGRWVSQALQTPCRIACWRRLPTAASLRTRACIAVRRGFARAVPAYTRGSFHSISPLPSARAAAGAASRIPVSCRHCVAAWRSLVWVIIHFMPGLSATILVQVVRRALVSPVAKGGDDDLVGRAIRLRARSGLSAAAGSACDGYAGFEF